MSSHEFQRPVQPRETQDRDAAESAHDDLAVRLPDWDLLPAAEFVRRARAD
jgi:hypothetical protein